MRVAPQELEIGEVSQRGGQGGNALVGEVVIWQAEGADPGRSAQIWRVAQGGSLYSIIYNYYKSIFKAK